MLKILLEYLYEEIYIYIYITKLEVYIMIKGKHYWFD